MTKENNFIKLINSMEDKLDKIIDDQHTHKNDIISIQKDISQNTKEIQS